MASGLMNLILETSFVSALSYPKQWRVRATVPTPSSIYTPLSWSCLFPARSHLMAPLHWATRESRRWIFQPSECSQVDTEKALKERDLSELKKQNKVPSLCGRECSDLKTKAWKSTHPQRNQGRARPQAPATSELHAWAKVTEALANIPRSFLPCAGPAPAASSEVWEDS